MSFKNITVFIIFSLGTKLFYIIIFAFENMLTFFIFNVNSIFLVFNIACMKFTSHIFKFIFNAINYNS
ncbi:ORF MSV078 hypothetical protein [Melanoplus sanguinipes entomopoxvirus]|uniref:Uncharacterized protein n=1 Tax=Melanoplus sanguinipes entomopoxvirus TaxID=83191 RepID=Q9YW14_MSEPV|nr:ORF MSV078 hypothetical protein [Melanoplus sanguinipes entomopoxvirus]AAC97812.1 ORF MSV078 hypothetical protein [Melanoplus sanguinipes entomopoxvirus 'O']